MIRNREILVNRDHPLPKTYRPGNLVAPFEAYENCLMEREAGENLIKLIEYIGGEDLIVPTSGYRSLKKQREIYLISLLKHGHKYTRSYVAREGESEHHTGLAIDLGLNKTREDVKSSSFRNHPITLSFLKEMTDFGFILRYPKDKESYTGISYEPWHFRYVGYPLSKYLRDKNLCLEEYYLMKEERILVNE